MSDGMGREFAYLSSHAPNRYFIPNWGQISREYSFVKLNARLEGTENLLSARAKSAQQYEQGNHKNNQEPSISESSQDPWDGISSIGLFAPANAQTFESFPEAESAKKKKKKRRNGFSL